MDAWRIDSVIQHVAISDPPNVHVALLRVRIAVLKEFLEEHLRRDDWHETRATDIENRLTALEVELRAEGEG